MKFTAEFHATPAPQAADTQCHALDNDPGEVSAALRPHSLCEPLCATRPVRHSGNREDFMPMHGAGPSTFRCRSRVVSSRFSGAVGRGARG